MSDEPLIPGPLYGLRTWRVVAEDGKERLAAPHRGTTWPTGGAWLEASCELEDHAAPAPGCDCGVHGYHPRRSTARQVLATRRDVPGIVEARGATEVHEDGFRAERARPYALVLAPGRNAPQAARLAEAYGVGVIEASGPDDLLAWCEQHGLGLGEPVVTELIGPRARGATARADALRVAAAVLVAAILVFAGLELIPNPPPDRVLNGRTGEIRTP
jgi:hypothetical protein